MHTKSRANSRQLGWWLALGLILVTVASPAWSLDLDRELARKQKDLDSIRITVRGPNGASQLPTAQHNDTGSDSSMSVELIAARTSATKSK